MKETKYVYLGDFQGTTLESLGEMKFKSNQNVQIMIDANPIVNGYVWKLTNNECGVRFRHLKTSYQPPISMIAGAPGHSVFNFETPDPAENYIRGLPCNLEFKQVQQWGSDESGETHTLKVTVGN